MTKLNAAGTALVYSTYLGGSGSDSGSGIAIDHSGNAFVAGSTLSANFPVTAGAFQTTLVGISNAFVIKLNAAGTALVYSTYLGSGSSVGRSIAVDGSSNAFVLGQTTSPNF
ncbi:SBBP repeat-containing protein, partial [Paenibacillus motobuensis]|uniref:SBBP repeat-containing protein n=1 Tax=Paenibacillus motobuensis TaxID=295324 RepID=UPI0031E4194A